MDNQIQTLRQMIDQSRYTVFFGGAGVSTESGIPDFRSPDGLYHLHYQYPPETIISHSFFIKTRRNFIGFTGITGSGPRLSPIRLTESWRSWRRRGGCKR